MTKLCLLGLALGASVYLFAGTAARLEVRVRAIIPVGKQPHEAALSVDETELYVAAANDHAVWIVRTADNRVSGRIPVECRAYRLAMVPGGSSVLVGCADTGLRVVTLPAGRVTPIPTGAVSDLAVSRDGKIAYLAELHAGLWKADLPTRQASLMSSVPTATNLALTPDGKFLYVNYQHYGPGGRVGHDAIGRFDARTGKFLGAITGLPNVGNALAVSPDGRKLWANGDDACISRRYDHLGCPAVPAGIVNIIDMAAGRLVRSLPLVAGVPGSITFSPDGRLLAVSGYNPCFLDARTFEILAQLPEMPASALVFCRNGRRAYATLEAQNAVAVIDLDCGLKPAAAR